MDHYCHRCGKKGDHVTNAWCGPCHKIVVEDIAHRQALPVGCNMADGVLWCTMHVFFIHLVETEEMLLRLRNEIASVAVATKSKISSTNLAELTPVNCVAARVVK